MSGWIALLVLIGATLALLWLLKLRGSTLTLAAAALLFGGAGYALQGSPNLPATQHTLADEPAPPSLAGARHAFFGTFTPAEHWLVLADSYARTGDTLEAAQITQSALRAHPQDPELWASYANALVDHAHLLTPAARVAYARAIAISPAAPGPHFFLGLAMLRSGDRAGAIEQWRTILAAAPPSAGWRPMVESGIALASR